MKDYVSFECTHFVESDQSNSDERHSIAYADIDGYPVDENEEGTVICRVWLLKEKNGLYPAYIVNWHLNAYRMNKDVLELIKAAKNDLKKFKDDMIENLAKVAYERHKLQWMLDNGVTLDTFIGSLDDKLDDDGLMDAYERLQDSSGFPNCKIWENFECFKVSEFEDDDYMKRLLTCEQYALWICRK